MNIGYIRNSTLKQENSVETQRKLIDDYSELNGIKIDEIIIDEGISGAKGRDEREGFDELIKGAVKKEFDIILVWDVSRLGRSLKHLVSFLDDIHSSNYDLYKVNSNWNCGAANNYLIRKYFRYI